MYKTELDCIETKEIDLKRIMRITNREIENLQKTSVASLMKISPYTNIDGNIFYRNNGEKCFFNNAYYDSKKAARIREEILNEIDTNEARPIILYGYNNCGKTTFIHSILLNEKNYRIIDFETVNCSNESNVIKTKMVYEISEKLRNLYEKKSNNVVKFYDFINSNYNLIHQIFDNKRRILNTINRINIDNKIVDFIQLQNHIEEIIKHLDLYELLVFDFLILFVEKLCSRRDRNKTYVCFDNLDNISINQLNKFLSNFISFFLNAQRFLSMLKNKHFNCIGATFVYIITLRETTKADVSAHNAEFEAWEIKKVDLSEVYEKYNIINKKVNFLKKLGILTDKQIKVLDAIQKFANNEYMKNYFFSLFNQSYKYAINTINQLALNSSERIDKYNELCNKRNPNYYMIANGIFLKTLLNQFSIDGVFNDKLKLIDLSINDGNKVVSISRELLTYLSNIEDNDGCSFDILLDKFIGIFSRDEICSTIKALYEMKKGKWAHLITFTSKSKYSLEKQVDNYTNNIKNTIYSKIKITLAGRTFLKTIASSFEFYSSRLYNRGQNRIHELPLGMDENCKVITINGEAKYRFEIIIENVYEAVKKCVSRLINYEKRIREKNNYYYKEYINSNYVFNTERGRTTHRERIIFSHIGYINSYRLYLLNEKNFNDAEKININRIIVTLIEKYLKLSTKNRDVAKSVSIDVYNSLEKQIEEIKNSDFNDFTTKIETKGYIAHRYFEK